MMEKDIFNIYLTFPSGDVFMSDAYTDRYIAEMLFGEIRVDDQIRAVRLDMYVAKTGLITTLASK